MKHHAKPRTTRRLNLDPIYNSSDPAVKSYLFKCLREELRGQRNIIQASDRIALRMANKFSHLLPPDQRALLHAPQAVVA